MELLGVHRRPGADVRHQRFDRDIEASGGDPAKAGRADKLSGSILPSRSFMTNIELAPSAAAYARNPSV